MKSVIVTGSAGFIGGHLTERLLREGHRVVGIDNLKSGLQSTSDLHLSYDNFTPKHLDIRSEEVAGVFKAFSPDLVFHLAAVPGVATSVNDPFASNDVNVNGTVNILNMSQKYGVKRLVFSSSSSVYGGGGELPMSEGQALRPKSPYALQKKIGEEYCRLFSKIYNLDTVCLRYFNVFGPRQRSDLKYSAAISSFCDSVVKDKNPIIYGDGSQTRDFCFVENVVYANILASNFIGRLNGDAINIGCGERISILSICNMLNTKRPIYKSSRPGDIMHSYADITKAKNTLGYNPMALCEEGLKKTLGWHKNI